MCNPSRRFPDECEIAKLLGERDGPVRRDPGEIGAAQLERGLGGQLIALNEQGARPIAFGAGEVAHRTLEGVQMGRQHEAERCVVGRLE
jgi:hypothetical protein